uniref:Transmembrane protein n=1 Tax=Palpitomonas bilix TaxID=652834 RepID=A0A7S3DBM3_9EUKA|mmetsp:Transcript_30070/g.77574  ORF Transcript_30070/g.77574 Transcript_30070/m.77574 type:complete len:247 (+) Transcript_30070:433-1173(+)
MSTELASRRAYKNGRAVCRVPCGVRQSENPSKCACANVHHYHVLTLPLSLSLLPFLSSLHCSTARTMYEYDPSALLHDIHHPARQLLLLCCNLALLILHTSYAYVRKYIHTVHLHIANKHTISAALPHFRTSALRAPAEATTHPAWHGYERVCISASAVVVSSVVWATRGTVSCTSSLRSAFTVGFFLCSTENPAGRLSHFFSFLFFCFFFLASPFPLSLFSILRSALRSSLFSLFSSLAAASLPM